MCSNFYSSKINGKIMSAIRLKQEQNLTVYVLTAYSTSYTD